MATSCGGSFAAAALSVARSALDERRLVGTDASDFSALAGARAGTIGATLRTRRQEIKLQPLEIRMSGGTTAYLKVEKPRFLFLEGSTGAAVEAVVATAALPDASPVRAASSAGRLTAGACAPTTGAYASAASAALGEGFHLLGRAVPRRSLLLLTLPTMSSLESPGEKVPAARAAGTPRPAVPGASAAGSSSPCVPPALAPVAVPRAAARARGVGGSDRAASTVTLC
jgi:hypothetical protein